MLPTNRAKIRNTSPKFSKFIAENQPAGTQLILGSNNDTGVEFGGKTINTPVEKYALLGRVINTSLFMSKFSTC